MAKKVNEIQSDNKVKILNLLNDKEVILVVPNELNSYFFEVRKKFPRLNFKLFTLNNLFKELRGDYLNDEVIKLGFKLFPNLTYSSIKEVSELIFKSFKINESNNDELIEFNNKLIEANLLKINEDFKNLLLSKEVLFVNFKASNLVKTLINELGLINYRFIVVFIFDSLIIPIKNIINKSPSYLQEEFFYQQN